MRKMVFVWMAVLAVAALSLNLGSSARAQEPTPAPDTSLITDNQVNAIARQLYCPVCENVPLDVCPTQACAEWRELIREQLASGMNEAEIKAYFVNRFGDRVLAAPPARGLNWLVYLIPPVLILIGAYILFRAMRIWKQRAQIESASILPESNPGQADEIDPYIEKLEDELRKL